MNPVKIPFAEFSGPVDTQFKNLTKMPNVVLAKVDISNDLLWDTYLGSFPQDINDIFRVRNHYDGNYDKNYIRRLGNVVAITATGERHTIWDVKVPSYFQDVANALSVLVKNAPLLSEYLTSEDTAGSKPNKDTQEESLTWYHFYSRIPSTYVVNKEELLTKLGESNTNISMFKKGLEVLTQDALETVLELINTNSLYRGSEFKKSVSDFLNYKKAHALSTNKENYVVYTAIKDKGYVRFRNTVIGTLVEDISLGVDLERAVASFESKVAPTNYRRTTSLISPRMVEDAQNTIKELGLLDSLDRRFATPSDISVNNVLFSSAKQASLSVLDDLKIETSRKVTKEGSKVLNKTEDISIQDFIKNVIPTAVSIEAYVESKHMNNFVTLLTANQASANPLFKWDNSFSWSYNGNITDAIQERVKSAGGSVVGAFRASLAWYNTDDLDLAIIEPNGNRIYFGSREGRTGGKLDIDANGPGHRSTTPVENIVWKHTPPDGTYQIEVNQFSKRNSTDVGYELQIACNGTLHSFSDDKSVVGRKVVCEVIWLNGSATIAKVHSSVTTSSSSQDIWNIKTHEFVPVSSVMYSPNFWDGQTIGNKHTFFILEDCKTSDKTIGFYNEFLNTNLDKHRKVFEVLGSKTSVVPTDEDQVAGLGFSDTVRKSLIVKVKGKTQRIFNIQF